MTEKFVTVEVTRYVPVITTLVVQAEDDLVALERARKFLETQHPYGVDIHHEIDYGRAHFSTEEYVQIGPMKVIEGSFGDDEDADYYINAAGGVLSVRNGA